MMDKKGQGLPLRTIILIVLGIVVLVFLIYGFSTGWGNFWDRITAYTGGSNVDAIKSGCELACSGNQVNAYCTEKREIKISSGENSKTVVCRNLKNVIDFEGCPNIDCPRSSSSEEVIIK